MQKNHYSVCVHNLVFGLMYSQSAALYRWIVSNMFIQGLEDYLQKKKQKKEICKKINYNVLVKLLFESLTIMPKTFLITILSAYITQIYFYGYFILNKQVWRTTYEFYNLWRILNIRLSSINALKFVSNIYEQTLALLLKI
jgi:hypothetical protein